MKRAAVDTRREWSGEELTHLASPKGERNRTRFACLRRQQRAGANAVLCAEPVKAAVTVNAAP